MDDKDTILNEQESQADDGKENRTNAGQESHADTVLESTEQFRTAGTGSSPEPETKPYNAAETAQDGAAFQEAPAGQAAVTDVPPEAAPIVFDDDFDANSEEYTAKLEAARNNIAANIEEQPRYQHPKLPFKEAVANFFYHNSTKLAIIGVTAVMLAIVIYQSLPEKYDYTFLIFSSNNYFSEEALLQIADNLEQYGEDLDGDGEVKVHALSFDTNSSDYNESMVSSVYMAEEFRKRHEAFLVLTDKTHYDLLTDDQDGFGEGLFESYKGEDKWIDATDSGLFLIDGVFNISEGDNTVGLSLVALNDDTMQKEKLVSEHDHAADMLERILEAHPEMKNK